MTNRWTLLENYKKVAPGKKEQIFWKTGSVAGSKHIQKVNLQNRSGGGPPPKPQTEAEEKIINRFEGLPSFEGIDGFTSEIDFGGMNNIIIISLY